MLDPKVGYKLLVAQIIGNDYLEAKDRQVLKDVVYALDLQGEGTLIDVNQQWITQQRIEANMVYLTSKYEAMVIQAERAGDEVESALYLDLPATREDGKRCTAEDRKRLLRLEPDVAVAKHKVVELQILTNALSKLSRTVFGRNQKLEQLGVNYRRELSSDGNY